MENSSLSRVWFITGTSTGFGRQLAEELLKRGERVIATARNVSTSSDVALRDLITAPSIAALGFASREKALATIESCFPLSADSNQMPRTAVVDKIKKCQREVHSARHRFAKWFHIAGPRRSAHRPMQHALAAAILAFYFQERRVRDNPRILWRFILLEGIGRCHGDSDLNYE